MYKTNLLDIINSHPYSNTYTCLGISSQDENVDNVVRENMSFSLKVTRIGFCESCNLCMQIVIFRHSSMWYA